MIVFHPPHPSVSMEYSVYSKLAGRETLRRDLKRRLSVDIRVKVKLIHKK